MSSAATPRMDPATRPPGCGPLAPPFPDFLRPLRQQVFERVRAAGSIARAQVARDLGVSPASVTAQTSGLIEAGLIEEREADPRGMAPDVSRGRPPVALGVKVEAHRVAGIKLSDSETTAVVMDFAGGLLASETRTRDAGPLTTAAAASAVSDILDRVLAAAGLARGDLTAIGLGIPGFVDGPSGAVLWSSVLVDRPVPFAKVLAAQIGLPVTIDNDANLVALAELWFGAGRARTDFAVVTIEHGVGMGMVLNHRLFRGIRGVGLELGHMKVDLDGALCRCGQRGCLEAYVADYALAREAVTALDWAHKDRQAVSVLLESLHDHAKAGSEAARSIFRRAGRYLALGLANVVNVFDPEVIILSGERMRFDYLYARETLAEMATLMLDTGRKPVRIETHAWGDLMWAHGAAALALSGVTEALLAAPPREVAAQ